jgi:hypothetical protein
MRYSNNESSPTLGATLRARTRWLFLRCRSTSDLFAFGRFVGGNEVPQFLAAFCNIPAKGIHSAGKAIEVVHVVQKRRTDSCRRRIRELHRGRVTGGTGVTHLTAGASQSAPLHRGGKSFCRLRRDAMSHGINNAFAEMRNRMRCQICTDLVRPSLRLPAIRRHFVCELLVNIRLMRATVRP